MIKEHDCGCSRHPFPINEETENASKVFHSVVTNDAECVHKSNNVEQADTVHEACNVAHADSVENAATVVVKTKVDEELTTSGVNPVTSGGIVTAIKSGKCSGDNLYDTTPTQGSTKAVQSGAVYDALAGKLDASKVKTSVTTATDEVPSCSAVNAALASLSALVYRGTATCATINALTSKSSGDLYCVEDSGTITNGSTSISVTAGQMVLYNGSAWAVWNAIAFDTVPTSGSSNAVTSNGILTYLNKKMQYKGSKIAGELRQMTINDVEPYDVYLVSSGDGLTTPYMKTNDLVIAVVTSGSFHWDRIGEANRVVSTVNSTDTDPASSAAVYQAITTGASGTSTLYSDSIAAGSSMAVKSSAIKSALDAKLDVANVVNVQDGSPSKAYSCAYANTELASKMIFKGSDTAANIRLKSASVNDVWFVSTGDDGTSPAMHAGDLVIRTVENNVEVWKVLSCTQSDAVVRPIAIPVQSTAVYSAITTGVVYGSDGTTQADAYENAITENSKKAVQGGVIKTAIDTLNTSIASKLPIPTLPTADGNYRLRLTMASGVATYSWVAES